MDTRPRKTLTITFTYKLFIVLPLVITLAGVAQSCKLSLEILTPWMKETIPKLKQFVKEEIAELPHGYMIDDLYLARWLAAKNFQVEPALELFKHNLKWRKEHRMDTIMKEDWKKMNSECPYQVLSADKLGRPLLYVKFGAWNIEQMARMMHLSDLGRYFAKMIEEADMKVRKARAKGQNVSQFTILVNLEGYSLRKHTCLHCLTFYAGLGETLLSHFPRVAEKIVFINAPPVFASVFDMLQKMLRINAKESIEIFGPERSRWEPALMEYVSQLPNDLQLSPMIENSNQTTTEKRKYRSSSDKLL